MAIVTRQGSGAPLTQSQGDTNWNTLNGINEAQTGTTHTIDQTDELKTIEYSNTSPIAVTLTAIATINGANDSQISDFKVTLKNVGAGLVTVTSDSTDTFEEGATSITLPQFSSVVLQTDSTGGIWNILNYTAPGAISRSYTSSDDKIDAFPSGTAMVFYQAAAPTGWTGLDTLSDHAIRIVTNVGAAGGTTGGSVDFTTAFGLTATDGYTLLVADIPSHTHTERYYQGTGGGGAVPASANNTSNATLLATGDPTGGDGSHAHGIDLRVSHALMIIATKD